MAYLARRLGEAVLTMVGAALAVFALVLGSTDELARQIAVGTEDRIVAPEEIEAISAALGLDDPLPLQFGRWLAGAAAGDLGWSFMAQQPVADVLLSRLPATAALAALALALTVLLSLPLGLLAARSQNGPLDLLIRGLTFVGLSLPGFWLGLLLLLLLGLAFPVLPILSGTGGWAAIILPAATLAIAMSSKYIRQVRAAVLEELSKDYVLGARARGMPETAILLREVLPNALVPLLSIFALSAGNLLGGAAVVEAVFGWPGLGQLALSAVEFRDLRLLQGLALWAAGCQTLLHLLTDLALRRLDPRLARREAP